MPEILSMEDLVARVRERTMFVDAATVAFEGLTANIAECEQRLKRGESLTVLTAFRQDLERNVLALATAIAPNTPADDIDNPISGYRDAKNPSLEALPSERFPEGERALPKQDDEPKIMTSAGDQPLERSEGALQREPNLASDQNETQVKSNDDVLSDE